MHIPKHTSYIRSENCNPINSTVIKKLSIHGDEALEAADGWRDLTPKVESREVAALHWDQPASVATHLTEQRRRSYKGGNFNGR
jgi:hypothetical protein